MTYRPMIDANLTDVSAEFAAVFYESQAARRDYSEAFKSDPFACIVWSLASYFESTQRVVNRIARKGERP
ncbi:hypothetical protein [Streptomyces hydrogenans]|uniref:Uncharacterized protein n=1 Tax=Streptomyces hydrogenans TaxID=1873719 RepID=A0ABQ3PJP3_9ACTN|nr:hypothetical protein [Streptomyces hydrogenans]GHG09884.1 hypothetical protein GCM10018784_23160 [Streptomyces hydrogenans]GHI25232.1 hypothetical protein Shyd_66030 [Streptomyces hydrogenans]